jgi:hypothetical protein
MEWTKELSPYLRLRGNQTSGQENQVFICPSANYSGWSNPDLSRTYACSGALMAPSNPNSATSGMTSQKPRKANSMSRPSDTILVVEGKKADFAATTRWCPSNIEWKSPEASTDLNMATPDTAVRLDFRHLKVMDMLYGDYGARAVKFSYATTSGGQTNISRANWDNWPQ